MKSLRYGIDHLKFFSMRQHMVLYSEISLGYFSWQTAKITHWFSFNCRNCSRYLGLWLCLCWDDTPRTVIPWWMWNWSTFVDFPVKRHRSKQLTTLIDFIQHHQFDYLQSSGYTNCYGMAWDSPMSLLSNRITEISIRWCATLATTYVTRL